MHLYFYNYYCTYLCLVVSISEKPNQQTGDLWLVRVSVMIDVKHLKSYQSRSKVKFEATVFFRLVLKIV